MTKRLYTYFNKINGSITTVTRSQAKKLSADWQKIEFVKNDKGENVMRFQFDGATVDVQENETKEVVTNGIPDSK